MHIFQIALLGLFGVLAVVGVLLLSTTPPKKDDVEVHKLTPVTIWGPPFSRFFESSFRGAMGQAHPELNKVTYVAKNPFTMYGELIEAVATGRGPDLIVFEASNLLSVRNKVIPVQYIGFPLSKYRETFVEGTEVFALSDGIYAMPLAVDPLVLFWNRDLFTNAAIAQVPKDWDTFVNLVPRLSTIMGGADLTQSAIAFGEYSNVLHAREIVATMLMQTGTPMVVEDGGNFKSVVVGDQSVHPEHAISFFTDFSNPLKTVYSWNKTFARSREAFAANKVAMYAGFASEIPILKEINPNLNFDVALWPQSSNGSNKLTYGKFYGVAVVNGTRNVVRAAAVLYALSGAQAAPAFESLSGLTTVRRNMLTGSPDDPFKEMLSISALRARTWLQPQSFDTDGMFSRMINSVVSGREAPSQAVSGLHNELNAALEQY